MNEKIEAWLLEIRERNARVERDKAWETSWTRRLLILGLTYLVCTLAFVTIGAPNPWGNAIVPSTGFFLSTLTLRWCKQAWLRCRYGKKTETPLHGAIAE